MSSLPREPVDGGGATPTGPATPRTTTDGRRLRALRTRQRVVEAAYRVFCERGYSAPLTDVAAAARVSVQSLYASYGTKIALLTQVLQHAVHGDDDPSPPHEREWFGVMAGEPDPVRAVLVMLEGTQGIYDRLGPLSGVFATNDPEISALWARSEQLRHRGLSLAVDVVLAKGPARVAPEAAHDMAFVLLGPDVYNSFVTDRGWTPEQWRRWTAETLVAAWF